MKSLPLIIAAFLIGWLACELSNEIDAFGYAEKRHWKTLEAYRKELADPDRLKPSGASDGLWGVSNPIDPEPSLAALHASGKIEYVDLIFPNVRPKRNVNLFWIEYANKHDDEILYILGNTNVPRFKTDGKVPLHLRVWFKRGAEKTISELTKKINSGFGNR